MVSRQHENEPIFDSKMCQHKLNALSVASRSMYVRQLIGDYLWRIFNKLGVLKPYFQPGNDNGKADISKGLKTGELVQIVLFEKILDTLDNRGKLNGLFFMPEMKQYCGQKKRVYKNVNRILLESTGKLRKMTNIVILENVICDGELHYHCDMSCFFFWKEAWLERCKDCVPIDN